MSLVDRGEEEAALTFIKSHRHSTHSKVNSQYLTSKQHWPNTVLLGGKSGNFMANSNVQSLTCQRFIWQERLYYILIFHYRCQK